MLTAKEVNTGWSRIIEIYRENRDDINKPEDAMNSILDEFGYDKTREIFATIAKIKKHNGRIYGENRDFMNATETNPDVDYTSRIDGIDDIHTAHINQLITELRVA